MIIQLTDFASRADGVTGNVENFVSGARFLHDRMLAIPETLSQPRIARSDVRGRYVLTFQMNETMRRDRGFHTLNLRINNGGFSAIRVFADHPLYTIRTLAPNRETLDIPVSAHTEKGPVYVLFNCGSDIGNPEGQWSLEFGKNGNFSVCDCVFDYIGLIRVHRPRLQAELEENYELPRFVSGFQYGYETLAHDLRGSVGQPYGRTIRQLRTLSVNFTRVPADVVDDYFRAVSVTEPHWVVPYPESLSVPPMWCTVVHPPRFTKRDENGWYWNCRMDWREAY